MANPKTYHLMRGGNSHVGGHVSIHVKRTDCRDEPECKDLGDGWMKNPQMQLHPDNTIPEDGTMVDVIFADGSINRDRPVEGYRWALRNTGGDICFWRLSSAKDCRLSEANLSLSQEIDKLKEEVKHLQAENNLLVAEVQKHDEGRRETEKALEDAYKELDTYHGKGTRVFLRRLTVARAFECLRAGHRVWGKNNNGEWTEVVLDASTGPRYADEEVARMRWKGSKVVRMEERLLSGSFMAANEYGMASVAVYLQQEAEKQENKDER